MSTDAVSTDSGSGDTGSVEADAAGRFALLIDGYLGTRLLYVAAELGLIDALLAGPRSAPEVAREVGADAAVLERHVLRRVGGPAARGPDRRSDVRADPRGAVFRAPCRAPWAGHGVPGVDAGPFEPGGRRGRRGLRFFGIRHPHRRRGRRVGAALQDSRGQARAVRCAVRPSDGSGVRRCPR